MVIVRQCDAESVRDISKEMIRSMQMIRAAQRKKA